ncbi:MAG TPA: flavin reductase family protein [Burkholderiaceae bacterium]|nr:flavin reductase family protein [Burkholderiaceae bacterium]
MTPTPADFDDVHFRSVVGRFPTGVTVITTETSTDSSPVGLTISSFHSLSLDPPLVLWTLTKKASSLTHFRKADRYVVHILSAEQIDLAQRFARGPQADRFRDVGLTRAPGGTIMLDDSRTAAWLECCNVTQHEAGDHFIFVGQVERCQFQPVAPLVYHAGAFDLTPPAQTIPDHGNRAIPL